MTRVGSQRHSNKKVVVVVVVVVVIVVFSITKGKRDITNNKSAEQVNSAVTLESCSHYTDSIRIFAWTSFTLPYFSIPV